MYWIDSLIQFKTTSLLGWMFLLPVLYMSLGEGRIGGLKYSLLHGHHLKTLFWRIFDIFHRIFGTSWDFHKSKEKFSKKIAPPPP